MRHTLKTFVFCAAALACLLHCGKEHTLRAQTPLRDLTVGNKFVYLYAPFFTSYPSYPSHSYYEEVLKDSVVAGKKYAVVFNSYDFSTRLERSDDSTIYVYSARQQREYPTHRSSLKIGDTIRWSGIFIFQRETSPIPQDWKPPYIPPIDSGEFRIVTRLDTSDALNGDIFVSTLSPANFASVKQYPWTSAYISEGNFSYKKKLGIPQMNYNSPSSYPTRNVWYQRIFLDAAIIKGEIIKIFGDTSLPRSTLCVPDRVVGKTGDTVIIPLYFVGARRALVNFDAAVTLSYQSSLLEPINLPDSIIKRNNTGIDSVRLSVKKIWLTQGDSIFAKVPFRIKNGFAGSFTVELSNLTANPYPVLLSLKSGVFSASSLRIQIPDIQAVIGKPCDLSISFIGARRLAELGVTSATTTLSFNASLLQPIESTPQGTVTNGLRRIPVTFRFDGATDTAVVRLRFQATLGNDTATALTLDSLSGLGGVRTQQTIQHGVFRLLDVTSVGGSPALFLSDKTGATLTASPNPFSDDITLRFTLNETARAEIVAYASDGRHIATVYEGTKEIGEHELVWHGAGGGEAATGTYSLVLFVNGHKAAETRVVKIR